MTRQFEAAYEIEKLAFEAFEIEPRTMAGALIQARALNACAETELEDLLQPSIGADVR